MKISEILKKLTAAKHQREERNEREAAAARAAAQEREPVPVAPDEVTLWEAELRKAKESAYVEEAEKKLRELRGLQQNLIGPLRALWILREAILLNQHHRGERFRIDNVRVRYTDPALIALKSPQVLHAKMTPVGPGKDSPVMPVEVQVPNPRVNEVTEWLPYATAERLVKQQKAVIVEEKTPVWDQRRVSDPLPAITDALNDLHLGRIILRDASPGMRELAQVIGPDLLIDSIGQTVDKRERESYLAEVER